MPLIDTAHFGVIECPADQVISFPHGIPGFENETAFVLIESPATAPVVYLQSATTPDLVFITLPPQLVDPAYPAAIQPEEWGAGESLDAHSLTLLALVTISPDRHATANLQAPVAIHWPTRQGWQLLRSATGYSSQHPLASVAQPEATPCS